MNMMDAVDKQNTDLDLSRYIQYRLCSLSSQLSLSRPDWCSALVDQSEGLFQWAATACQFIKGQGAAGMDTEERLEIVLATGGGLYKLDKLYLEILERTFDIQILE